MLARCGLDLTVDEFSGGAGVDGCLEKRADLVQLRYQTNANDFIGVVDWPLFPLDAAHAD